MFKAVIFDIDNTLTENVSWLKITELIGASVASHEDIFRRFSDGVLPYEQAKRQLIDLWRATGKAQKSHWEALFQNWSLVEDARLVVDYLQKKDYETVLITGSIDLFAEGIARELHVDRWYANTATQWDASGELADFQYVKDQAAQKLVHLERFCDEMEIKETECVAVGDGENDTEVFRVTEHGIAVGQSSSALDNVAWKHVNELADLMDIL
jgi:HAD superfamily phosphoserine phosphatase-like hydrolase